MINSTRRTSAVTRVMFVDDHAVIRSGLKALVEAAPGWEVCGEASDGEEALRVAAECRPDIVVMDVSMPKLGGVDATIELKKILPDVEVLILTMHESDRLADQVRRAGARGYLLKTESESKLIEALEALARHRPFMSPREQKTLQGHLNSSPSFEQLTARERQIVKLIAEGNTNKRIAIILKVSVKTVETHRSAAMHKVGAKSSADLTLYAARNDLIQI